MVITTKLGDSASSRMFRDRWRQLVIISCLVYTTSTKPRGHSPLRRVQWVSNPDRCFGARSNFTSSSPMAWRLITHAEDVYISFIEFTLYVFICYLSNFDKIIKRMSSYKEASR